MIKLETEFVSGEAGFSQDPLTYKQVKRTDAVALYERSRNGVVKDYEVFLVKVKAKGTKETFPNGVVKILEDDTERYPSTGQWGRIAWSFRCKGGAEAKFDELVKGVTEEAEEEEKPESSVKTVVLTIPEGEWTVGELAEKNHVSYPAAFLFVKAALGEQKVKFVREERRHAKGKASKLYSKV
jgi:hypothetical protein